MPASPEDLYALLRELGIPFRLFEHPPLHTVTESRGLRGRIPGAHCKSLFLRDRKGREFLLVCLEHRRPDMRWVQKQLGCGRISFGKPERLREALGVRPGAVTPFALINDREERRLQVVLDEAMTKREILNYHPLHNEATLSISRADFRRFLDACGHETVTLRFEDAPGSREDDTC